MSRTATALLVIWIVFPGAAHCAEPGRHRLFPEQSPIRKEACRAGEGSPEPIRRDSCLVLRCPFQSGLARAFWDIPFPALDVSPFTSLTLDLSCPDPDPIRSLSVYLRSAAGWYEYETGPLQPGRQRLVMPLNRFRLVGTKSAAGLRRVDCLRISPWAGDRRDTRLELFGAWLNCDRVWLVTSSMAGAAAEERAAARNAARRISRWLRSMEIPHAEVAEAVFSRAMPRSGSVAIICYIPRLRDETLDALRRLVNQGGRIIVYYSSDERLAELLHFDLQPYMSAPAPGAWSSYRMIAPREMFLPVETVYQRSWNLRPVLPGTDTAAVAAWWYDARGRRTKQPAWVRSSRGWWFSHIPLADDAFQQRQLLVSLLAEYLPEVREAAARRMVADCGRIDSYRSLADARWGIERLAAGGSGKRRVAALLAAAESDYAAARKALASRQWSEAARAALEVRRSLTRAYALAVEPFRFPVRGVWIRPAGEGYAGDWERICRQLARHRINTIFVLTATAGTAHYPSEVLPPSEICRRYGDQVAACLKAARRYGISVHAWIMCWYLEGASPELIQKLRREGRLQTDDSGRPLDWLSPADERNRTMMLRAIREIVHRYELDGVHLDYIRFASSRADFSAAMRRRYETSFRRPLKSWPPRQSRGERFQRWKASVVDDFVREVSRTIREVRPGTRVSAAVFPEYPQCVRDVGQDWVRWVKRGWVDFICPMNYEANMNAFRSLVDRQVRLVGTRRMVVGIGVTTAACQLAADRVLERLAYLDRRGLPGIIFFDLDATLLERILPLCLFESP